VTQQFTNPIDFMSEVLARTYRRQLEDASDKVWCSRWYLHPEAVMRVEGMWLAWEAARGQADGLSVWLRDHADPHMAVLFATDGPFHKCKTTHKPGAPPLPVEEPRGMHLVRAARMAPVPPPTTEDELRASLDEQAAIIEDQEATIENLRNMLHNPLDDNG
jgi:hypothetical protein